MMTFCSFLLSVLSSLIAIGLLYLLYYISACWVKGRIAKAECWWLPSANTFRFVARNMNGSGNLSDLQYRVWLRRDIPSREGISVTTLDDIELCEGKRLLLPKGQDLSMICFRLEDNKAILNLVVTDKMGESLSSYPINDNSVRLMVEFSVRTRTWFFFKHEISRIYAIPQFKTIEGVSTNIFREFLLPMQSSNESKMELVSQYADEVTVTV
jgi:hypothetical protein